MLQDYNTNNNSGITVSTSGSTPSGYCRQSLSGGDIFVPILPYYSSDLLDKETME